MSSVISTAVPFSSALPTGGLSSSVVVPMSDPVIPWPTGTDYFTQITHITPTTVCPPPPEGSGCREGYTAACVSIHGQLRATPPTLSGSAKPLTHTLCCPRTYNGFSEGVFSFTCAVQSSSWSVCHSVVQQETWSATVMQAGGSATVGPVTETWGPGDDVFAPPIAPMEIGAGDVGCTPAPATGPQTLPTLSTPLPQSSSSAATATGGTAATTGGTPTTTPEPAGAAGMPGGTTSLKTAVAVVLFALLGVAAL